MPSMTDSMRVLCPPVPGPAVGGGRPGIARVAIEVEVPTPCETVTLTDGTGPAAGPLQPRPASGVPVHLASVAGAPVASPSPRFSGLLLPGPQGDALRAAITATRIEGEVDEGKVADLLQGLPRFPRTPEGLRQFAAAGLSRRPEDVVLRRVGGEGYVGHAEVYFVKGPAGQTLGVLKMYGDGVGSFGCETSGMLRMMASDVRGVRTSKPIMLGQTEGSHGPEPMMLMTCAMGPSLNDHVMAAAHAATPEDRAVAWQTLKDAVAGSATALARLHAAATGSGTRTPDVFVSKYIERLSKDSHRMLEDPRRLELAGVDGGLLQRQVEARIAGVQALGARGEVPNSLIQGDAHPGNFCYDPGSGVTTLIDLASMEHSMDADGNPMGCPAYDVSKLKLRLDSLMAGEGFSQAQRDEAATTFDKAYRMAGGPTMQPEVVRFFDLVHAVVGSRRKLKSLNPQAETADARQRNETAGIRFDQLNDVLKAK